MDFDFFTLCMIRCFLGDWFDHLITFHESFYDLSTLGSFDGLLYDLDSEIKRLSALNFKEE